ncbi:MAG: FHA domain-containing protein [Planctomycetota bacterium]|jgi:uncharacterized protein YkwD
MAFLKVYTNGEERTVFLGDEPIIVGRGQDTDVMLRDGKASRRHAVIEPCGGGRWRVLDMGSGNGTKVNGKRIEKRNLRPDDVITVGDARIVFAGTGAAVVAEEPVRYEDEAPPSRVRRPAKRSATPFVIMGAVLVAAAAVLLFVWDNSGSDKPRYGNAATAAFKAVQSASTDKETVELADTFLRKYPGSDHEADVRRMAGAARERLRTGASAKARGRDFSESIKGLATLDAITKLEEMAESASLEDKPSIRALLGEVRAKLRTERDTLFQELLKVFNQHVDEGEYARAHEIWFFLRGDPRFEPIPSGYITKIVSANSRLETQAAAARSRLFEDVGRAENAHDFKRARGLLLQAMPRFKGTSVVRSMNERLAFLDEALRTGVSGLPTQAPSAVTVDVEKRIQEALAVLERRDFKGAAASLATLAKGLKDKRHATEVLARAAECRSADELHKAMVRTLQAKPPKGRIGTWRVVAGGPDGVSVKSKGKELTYTWAEAPAELYLGLALKSAKEQPLGACVLGWAVAGEGGLAQALAVIAEEPRTKPVHAFIAAQVRKEVAPEGGYVADAGKVVTRKEYLRRKEEALIKQLTKQYDEAYAAIKGDSSFKALEKLTKAKDKLDEKRKFAKALIYDEKKYFYPYRGSGRMREYMQVQAEVDRRVDAVRELWAKARPSTIKASNDIKRSLAKFDEAAKELEKRLIDVEERVEEIDFLRSYIGRKFTIQTFYRTPEERELLDYSNEVMAYNEKVEGDITETERAQVRVTNVYRIMFGHQSVRLVEKLVKSSRGHCEEMSRLGYFGHFSPTPGRRTPYDRMKLEGYTHGASENCIMGQTSPEGSHAGWCHSSGHHRNLLMPHWTEMGTGHYGRYMTQNFGQPSKWRQADRDRAAKEAAEGGDDDDGCGCGCGCGDGDDFDYDDEG